MFSDLLLHQSMPVLDTTIIFNFTLTKLNSIFFKCLCSVFFPYKCDGFLTWDCWCLYGSELPNRDGRYFCTGYFVSDTSLLVIGKLNAQWVVTLEQSEYNGKQCIALQADELHTTVPGTYWWLIESALAVWAHSH